MIHSTAENRFYFFTKRILHLLAILLVSFSLIFFTSCKKEKKETLEIIVWKPENGLNAKFLDTISVKAEIHSSSIIQTVTVVLIDQNQIPVSAALNYSPGSSTFHIDDRYIPDNKYAPSGNYFLEIKVKGSETIKRVTIEIYLEAIPKALETVYFFSKSDDQYFTVSRMDSNQINPVFNVNGDFLAAAISSRYNSIYTCGENTGGLKFFDIGSSTSFFSLLPFNPSNPPYFTSFHFSDELIYSARFDGSIKAYDQTGFLRYDTEEDPYFTALAISKTGNYVLAELLSTNVLHERKLAAYFFPSGIRRQLLDIDFDIINMYELTSDEKLIFAMKNGHLLVYKYSIQNNNVNLIKDAGLINLNHATRLSTSEYLLATAQGVFHYDYNLGSNINVATFSCIDIIYEDVNNQHYCISGNDVHVLNAGTFFPSTIYNLIDTVVAVKALYNK